MKKQIMSCLILLVLVSGCQMMMDFGQEPQPAESTSSEAEAGLECEAQAEEIDYKVYRMHSDGARVGDVMPFYDSHSGKFYIYYLKDVWNDATHERHPWYGFTTTDFFSYQEICHEAVLPSSSIGCEQDYAIGTGSVIPVDSGYYAFYTGHNPNYPSSCVSRKEGIMLAWSAYPGDTYEKVPAFNTIYAPQGMGFDEQDNFRDPYVFHDAASGQYQMLVSARKDHNGSWRGVLARYTSTDLWNWTYQGILYDGGSSNLFMLECAEVFEMNGTWYLLFSDINTKYVHYRKASSPNGPWSLPQGTDRFEGTGIYAAKTVADSHDRYILGWTPVNTNHSDSGAAQWGGNLVVHKLYQLPNGDLAVTIPHTVETPLETNSINMTVNSQWGNVTNTQSGTHSYRLVSQADYDMTNVIFEPITAERYMITATVSYTSASRDFGFMIGACDGWNDLFSLRFVPSQNRFSFDKTPRPQITNTTVADNDVPLALAPDTSYSVRIVIENSMVVVYLDDRVALASRVYRATGTHWGIFVDHSDATFSDIQVSTD